MVEELEQTQADDAELQALAEETTELGLLAEDIYKNATAALLFGQQAESAWVVMEDERTCAQTYRAVHAKSLELLTRSLTAGEEIRHIVEWQQLAAGFAHIASASARIAEQALGLGSSAEAHLMNTSGEAGALLMYLVRQAYVEIRGCVLACTIHDPALARRLIAEDGELDRLFLLFKRELEREIALNPRSAPALNRLLLVGVYLEDIGNRVVSACQAMLFQSPGHGA